MEYFDVVDATGNPIGDVVLREEAHAKGIMHRTVHIWVVRERDDRLEVLMQKRSYDKDSFPGQYDTSCAGHIEAGEGTLDAAIRELSEELGINASSNDLCFIDTFPINYAEKFHGKLFIDREVAFLYIYKGDVDIEKLVFQPEEVEGVAWFDLEYIMKQSCKSYSEFCAPIGGLIRVKEWYDREKLDKLVAKSES